MPLATQAPRSGQRQQIKLIAAAAVIALATGLTAQPAAAHEPEPRTPPQAETGNCVGALPIVVASDTAAQSDMYSAVTLAGAVGTECIILAGARNEPFPASELECLEAAASKGYVVGGTAAVPESKISGRSLKRISGADRWATARVGGAEVQRVLADLDDAARKRNAGTGTAGTRGCGSSGPSSSSSGTAGNELTAAVLWEAAPSGPSEFFVVWPKIVDGVVFAASHGRQVLGLDAATGEPRWSFEADSDLSPPPFVDGDVVHALDLDTHYALDALSGRLLWRRPSSSGSVHAPELRGGIAYVYSDGSDVDSAVSAIEGTSGRVLWNSDVRSTFLPPFFPLVADDEHVYISDDGDVHALERESGDVAWTAHIETSLPPVSAGGTVFMFSASEVVALDQATGELLWSHEPQITGVGANLSGHVGDGVLYLPADDLHALDTADGSLLWSASVFVIGSPYVTDDSVYISALGDTFHALDPATGAALWSAELPGSSDSMVLEDGVVYVHSVYGQLFAIDARYGDVLWLADATFVGGDQRAFAVADGTVYAGYQSTDGSGVRAVTAPRDGS